MTIRYKNMKLQPLFILLQSSWHGGQTRPISDMLDSVVTRLNHGYWHGFAVNEVSLIMNWGHSSFRVKSGLEAVHCKKGPGTVRKYWILGLNVFYRLHNA